MTTSYYNWLTCPSRTLFILGFGSHYLYCLAVETRWKAWTGSFHWWWYGQSSTRVEEFKLASWNLILSWNSYVLGNVRDHISYEY